MDPAPRGEDRRKGIDISIPHPTPQFRRRAWIEFQRALDPLSPPKPLRPKRHH